MALWQAHRTLVCPWTSLFTAKTGAMMFPLKDYKSILSAFLAGRKALWKHWKNCWLLSVQRQLAAETFLTIPEEAQAGERWMMEQSRDCSSRSLKAGKNGTGDLSRCFLFLCFSFTSKLMMLWASTVCSSLLSMFASCLSASAALSLLACSPFLYRIWVICCQGREFPLVHRCKYIA